MPDNQIAVGAKFELSLSMTPEFVAKFAEFSGDINPIHMDIKFAQETAGMPKPIAHGMISAAIFSKIFGMYLPGPGCLWHSQNFDFLFPIFVGEEVLYRAECIGQDRGTGLFRFSTQAEVNGRLCISGNGCVSVVGSSIKSQEIPGESKKSGVIESSMNGEHEQVPRECVLVIGASSEIGRACITKCFGVFPDHLILAVSNSRKACEFIPTESSEMLELDGYDVSAPSQSLDRLSEVLLKRQLVVSKLIYAVSPSIEYNSIQNITGDTFVRFFYGNVGGIADLISKLYAIDRISDNAAAVVVSSDYTAPPFPQRLSPYIVAKTALEAYVKCASTELASSGLRINSVAPGLLDSGSNVMVPAKAKIKARIDSHTKCLTNCFDVADTVLFLLSENSRQISGQTIYVNGGK